MPVDKENNRFSRFTAKLLNRSSSSAKSQPDNPSQSASRASSIASSAHSVRRHPLRDLSTESSIVAREKQPLRKQAPARQPAPQIISVHDPGSGASTIRLQKNTRSSTNTALNPAENNEGDNDKTVKSQLSGENLAFSVGDRVQSTVPYKPPVLHIPPPVTASRAVKNVSPAATTSSPAARARHIDGPKEASNPRRSEDSNLIPSPTSQEALPFARTTRLFNPRGASLTHSIRSLNVVDETGNDTQSIPPVPTATTAKSTTPTARPSLAIRRQSLVPSSQQRLIKSLLEPSSSASITAGGDYFSRGTPAIQPDMIHRKVWVRRLGSSPTLVMVTEEDLVDDLRESILRKYANSLGRTIDSPDISLKLIRREPSSRQSHQERLLGPEEPVGRTLDLFYPGGQTVDEALIIEVPQRRTPKTSPLSHSTGYTHSEDLRNSEPAEYFPPMSMIQTPNASCSNSSAQSAHHGHQSSISVITTGQLPVVPSPGSRGSWQQQHQSRLPYTSQYPAPPTASGGLPSPSAIDSVNPLSNGVGIVGSPPTTTPPVPTPELPQKQSISPPSRVSSPRPTQKVRVLKKSSSGTAGTGNPSLPPSLLDGTIPPINVLIVEDNTINLKLLEAFLKRLKVRWQTAMNGRDAVNKWREGGFHLVLMDIQLPVMNGLDATREIRRLERVNNIGVFSRTVFGPTLASSIVPSGTPPRNNTPTAPPPGIEPLNPEDVLNKESQFKSPVIIVALTASSLQSDRHEALAAGCNDFLTKPVNMMWLEQKVTEWGCMQALIDFEGWRRWRGYNDNPPLSLPNSKTLDNAITNGPISESPKILATAKRSPATSPGLGNGISGNIGDSFGRNEPALAQSAHLINSGKNSSGSSILTVVPQQEPNSPTPTPSAVASRIKPSSSDSKPDNPTSPKEHPSSA
ncbi:ssk1 response regulator receiver [Myotisia sp. PD_48]|nr:ssk1 response regulator receiver [Myotisia sp. PD_48]